MEVNLKMTLEGFCEKYITPAVKRLARKILNGDPLDALELKVCDYCGIEIQQ